MCVCSFQLGDSTEAAKEEYLGVIRSSMLFSTALFLLLLEPAAAFTSLVKPCPSPNAFALRPRRVAVPPIAGEYSTKVQIMAETRAPLRQARLFFLYPSVIAGASIAAYVSILRVIGGGEGVLTDAGNLAVNAGVVAGAVFLGKKDLDGREQTLKEIAIELGEAVQEDESDADGSR